MKAVANGVWPLARGDGSIDSKSPEYQKYLAENDAVVLFLEALKQHQKSEDIVASCCRAMEAICVNDTTCKEAESAGGLKLLTNLIRDQKDCEKVVAKCASCLSCFARCDLNKPKIVRTHIYPPKNRPLKLSHIKTGTTRSVRVSHLAHANQEL